MMLGVSAVVADLVYRFIERPILEFRNAHDARPFAEISDVLRRLHTRMAFEIELLISSHEMPACAPALVDRRKMPRI